MINAETALLQYYGIHSKMRMSPGVIKNKRWLHMKCVRCGAENEAQNSHCVSCRKPLNLRQDVKLNFFVRLWEEKPYVYLVAALAALVLIVTLSQTVSSDKLRSRDVNTVSKFWRGMIALEDADLYDMDNLQELSRLTGSIIKVRENAFDFGTVSSWTAQRIDYDTDLKAYARDIELFGMKGSMTVLVMLKRVRTVSYELDIPRNSLDKLKDTFTEHYGEPTTLDNGYTWLTKIASRKVRLTLLTDETGRKAVFNFTT